MSELRLQSLGPAIAQIDHEIGLANQRRAMRDGNDRHAALEPGKRCGDDLFGLSVERARRFIEHQQPRRSQQRTYGPALPDKNNFVLYSFSARSQASVAGERSTNSNGDIFGLNSFSAYQQ